MIDQLKEQKERPSIQSQPFGSRDFFEQLDKLEGKERYLEQKMTEVQVAQIHSAYADDDLQEPELSFSDKVLNA